MKGIKNKLKLGAAAGLAALLASSPAQSLQPSPTYLGTSRLIYELAEDYDKNSQALGAEFLFEVQMEIPPEDATCIDNRLGQMSGGKYRFIPKFDRLKGHYFKIEKSMGYLVSN